MMGSPFQGSFQGGLSVNTNNQVLSGGMPVVDGEGAASQRSLKKVTHACALCKKDHASCDNGEEDLNSLRSNTPSSTSL